MSGIGTWRKMAMRDPNRIKELLALFEAGWKKVPDLRFGQIIENLKRYIGKEDIFYLEDDIMLDHIKDYFNLDEVSLSLDTCPACGRYSVDGGVCKICQKTYDLYE